MLRRVSDNENSWDAVMYFCPAVYPPEPGQDKGFPCGLHMLPTGGRQNSPNWTLHSLDPLHIEPSVLSYGLGEHRCHSYVRNGHVEFLSDCTHELAGQTVELPDLPDWIVNDFEPFEGED